MNTYFLLCTHMYDPIRFLINIVNEYPYFTRLLHFNKKILNLHYALKIYFLKNNHQVNCSGKLRFKCYVIN